MSKSYRAVAYESQRGGALFMADVRPSAEEARQDAEEMAGSWKCASTVIDGAATDDEITLEVERLRDEMERASGG